MILRAEGNRMLMNKFTIPYFSRSQKDLAALKYQVLAPRDEPQMAVVSVLIRAMKRPDLTEILQHPLLQAFIGRKWLHFNKIFYSLVIIYVSFVISLSWYTIELVHKDFDSEWPRRLMTFFACVLFCHNLLQFLAEMK